MAEELIKLGGYVVQGHGSDETVLWEGNTGVADLNLSESIHNFEYVILKVKAWERIQGVIIYDGSVFQFGMIWQQGDTNNYHFSLEYNLSSDGKTLSCSNKKAIGCGTTSANSISYGTWNMPNNNIGILKVVGVGRKPTA